MNRTQSTRFVVVLASSFALLLAARASGQVTVGAASATDAGTVTPGGATSTPNMSATDLSASPEVKLSLKGDWIMQMPRNDSSASEVIEAFLPIPVGNIPVQVSNLGLDSNAKWVNGGGTAAIPVTSWTVTASIREQLGNSPGGLQSSDPALMSVSTDDSLTGNGLRIVNQSTTLFDSTILGSTTKYYLAITFNTSIKVVGFDNSMPTVTVTDEFGGSLGDTFGGFTASFDTQTVPEPGALTLAALGALGVAALVRYRKSSN